MVTFTNIIAFFVKLKCTHCCSITFYQQELLIVAVCSVPLAVSRPKKNLTVIQVALFLPPHKLQAIRVVFDALLPTCWSSWLNQLVVRPLYIKTTQIIILCKSNTNYHKRVAPIAAAVTK